MGNYNQFANYANTFLSSSVVRDISSGFNQDIYRDDPQKVLVDVQGQLMDLWDENADLSPSRGNPDTQRRNFEKFLEQLRGNAEGIVKKPKNFDKLRKNFVFDNVDFYPLFQKYPEAIKASKLKLDIVEEKKLDSAIKQSRVRKLLRQLDQSEEADATMQEIANVNNPTFVNKIKRQVENSIKGGHLENVLAIRRSVLDSSLKRGGLNSVTAQDVVSYIDQNIKQYSDNVSPLGLKSDNELRRELQLKGLTNVSALSGASLRSAAKNNDIGLRNFQITKDRAIEKIENIRGSKDAALNNLSTKELRKLLESLNPKFKKVPDKKPWLREFDIPDTKGRVKNIYEQAGLTLTDSQIDVLKDRVLSENPYLVGKDLERAALKDAAKSFYEKNKGYKPLKDEVVKRYMDFKYGDKNRKPSLEDLRILGTKGRGGLSPSSATFKVDISKRGDQIISRGDFTNVKKDIYDDYLRKKDVQEARQVDIAVANASNQAVQNAAGEGIGEELFDENDFR